MAVEIGRGGRFYLPLTDVFEDFERIENLPRGQKNGVDGEENANDDEQTVIFHCLVKRELAECRRRSPCGYSFRGIDVGEYGMYTPCLAEYRAEGDGEADGQRPHASLDGR